jgi:hypothetical protein
MTPDNDLPILRNTAHPRRSDDAFGRAVAHDVAAARRRQSGAALLPLLAPVGVGLGILAFVTLRSPRTTSEAMSPVVVAASPASETKTSPRSLATGALALWEDDNVIDADDAWFDDDTLDDLVALTPGDAHELDPTFTSGTAGGSMERELEHIEHALDVALAKKL